MVEQKVGSQDSDLERDTEEEQRKLPGLSLLKQRLQYDNELDGTTI